MRFFTFEPFSLPFSIFSFLQLFSFFSIFGSFFPFLADGAISAGKLPIEWVLKCVLKPLFLLKVPARERRRLFTFWSCDAVEALMQRPDIIRRAFRGTSVGIDVEGKMIDHIPFPGFETYEPPKIDEEHVEELLTKEEAEILEKTEMEFQEKKKKRKKEEKAQELRKRAKIRPKNL